MREVAWNEWWTAWIEERMRKAKEEEERRRLQEEERKRLERLVKRALEVMERRLNEELGEAEAFCSYEIYENEVHVVIDVVTYAYTWMELETLHKYCREFHGVDFDADSDDFVESKEFSECLDAVADVVNRYAISNSVNVKSELMDVETEAMLCDPEELAGGGCRVGARIHAVIKTTDAFYVAEALKALKHVAIAFAKLYL